VPPTIVSSGNGRGALPSGIRILARGGSALDAVEACARIVESDPSDNTVGYGGLPNVLGVVELDASIVDGTTHAAGSVAALTGFLHPITVARAVMEDRAITNVTGAYSNSRPTWRHVAKAPAETTMWMAQTAASGMLIAAPHPRVPDYRAVGLPIRWDRQRPGVRRVPPLLGEHSADVLTWLGYTLDDVRNLQTQGVVQ